MKFQPYKGPMNEKLEKNFISFPGFVELGEAKALMFPIFENWNERYKNFESKPGDVWVVSYPKAGTTWTQELVWCVLNDVDSKKAEELLMKRFPFFEWDGMLPEDTSVLPQLEEDDPCRPGVTWSLLHTNESPRTIKSHLHMFLLPDSVMTSKAKIVYVCRDPRDVCVSYYYHHLKLAGYLGTFDDFFDLFVNDALLFSPFWKHVLNFWERRHDENILFIRFEDLKQDLKGMIRRVAEFLGKDLSDDYVNKLEDHLSFSSMRTNKAVNNESITFIKSENSDRIKFMRKGQVGDWKGHLSESQTEVIRKWTEENLRDSDFPYYRDY